MIVLLKLLSNKVIKYNYRYNNLLLLSSSIETITKRIPFKLTDIGEGIAEVELLKWFVKKGDNVKSFDKICEVQSDKATVEITSRYDGIITTIHHSEGSIVKVGEALIDIDVNEINDKLIDNNDSILHDDRKNNNNDNTLQFKHDNDNDNINNKVLTTPSVRKIAKENSIKLPSITATGPKGRILKEDVLAYINQSKLSLSPSSSSTFETKLTATNDKVVPIKGIQKAMLKQMRSALDVQHLTYSDEFIVDELIKLRKMLKFEADKRNIRVSYMPLIIKATSLALLEFPILNATVNTDVTAMTYHSDHNIGVAIDSGKGLVVPVIKNVERKNIFEIAQELKKLQDAALAGTLSEAQLSNGTFTLSNIGSIGGTYTVPVIVVPQVLIGAWGRHQIVPRYEEDTNPELIYSGKVNVKPVTIMNISWSADHRVTDGATVARFSNLVKQYIQEPLLMVRLMK